MDSAKRRQTLRSARQRRIRKRVTGTDSRPRMTVFRSNKHLYVQVISDETGKTLASASTRVDLGGGVTCDKAKQIGGQIADKCKSLGIDHVVFDRSGYKYHGRIKAVADAAREGGLKL